MERICRLSDWINRVAQYVGFVQLSLMTFVIILQVFYRYVLGSSLSWSEESARFLFIWVVMLGASMGVKEGFHVAVTLFVFCKRKMHIIAEEEITHPDLHFCC